MEPMNNAARQWVSHSGVELFICHNRRCAGFFPVTAPVPRMIECPHCGQIHDGQTEKAVMPNLTYLLRVTRQPDKTYRAVVYLPGSTVAVAEGVGHSHKGAILALKFDRKAWIEPED